MDVPTILRSLRCVITLMLLSPLSCTRASTDAATSTLFLAKARIDIVVESNGVSLPMEVILHWADDAARAVEGYYSLFPVPYVAVYVAGFRGSGVRGGMTFGAPRGGRIFIQLGDKTSEAYLKSDWTLTHEMVHLAFPSVADRHHWIEEGIATYVEPIARVRAGQLAPEKMWEEVIRDMPQGLPEPGDKGLDRTHTWGRTYWGGAMYCLLADIEIRRQTDEKKGLQDALRAVLLTGGDIRQNWTLTDTLQAGDRATGTRVLENLYEKMKASAVSVDLQGIWADLGVRIGRKGVVFDDDARSAATRRAIVSPPPSSALLDPR